MNKKERKAAKNGEGRKEKKSQLILSCKKINSESLIKMIKKDRCVS